MDDTLTTNRLGQFALLKVEMRAMQKGILVSRPTVECRYDLVLDDGTTLSRAQVKYAGSERVATSRGAVAVGLRKWRNSGRAVLHHYKASEIDLLLVYLRRLDCILCFGPDVFEGRSALQIRTEPTRNGQRRGCLMAADFVW